MAVLHDPTLLPENLPAPLDDGAARHLPGMRLPDLALPATDRSAVNLSKLPGRTVVYAYPRTGRPGRDMRSMNACASSRMSLPRERSGGTWMRMTLTR